MIETEGEKMKVLQSIVWLFFIGCISRSTRDKEDDSQSRVDILFVIDNSASMQEESLSLGSGMYSFWDRLQNMNINANIGITTTSVDYSAGPTTNIDVGEAGLLTSESLNSEEDTYLDFQKELYCHTTFWIQSEIPSNPSYVCGDETDEVTIEYLDCLCDNNWTNISGSGNEEPLEAAYLALCRASEDPPDECYNASPFEEADTSANIGFLRSNTTSVIVMIGDEGDNSRRMQQGQEDPETYIDLFSEFEQDILFYGIGPNWDGSSLLCNSGGATTWAVERIQKMAVHSGGQYAVLEIPTSSNGDECELVDFSEHLNMLFKSIKSYRE